MSLKNLLIFTGIVCLLFGLVLMICPQVLAKMIFINPDLADSAIATARNYGILLFGVGIATFSARNSIPSTARRAYLIQTAIAGILITVYDIYGILSGIYNSSTWGVVALTGIIGIWGLMLLTKEKAL
jgi:hypothetical protein